MATRKPKKRTTISPELARYYLSPAWMGYCEQVKHFWSYRCAICYRKGSLQVHHRTYVRLYNELLTDCIPVCARGCHPFADKRRRLAVLQERKQNDTKKKIR